MSASSGVGGATADARQAIGRSCQARVQETLSRHRTVTPAGPAAHDVATVCAAMDASSRPPGAETIWPAAGTDRSTQTHTLVARSPPPP
jgi:hypothetical protein